jgi:hypothetical protein
MNIADRRISLIDAARSPAAIVTIQQRSFSNRSMNQQSAILNQPFFIDD